MVNIVLLEIVRLNRNVSQVHGNIKTNKYAKQIFLKLFAFDGHIYEKCFKHIVIKNKSYYSILLINT